MDTKKLRQKILDLAIHGKLVPQDPNDEPASVLLKRILAEKEQLIKEGKIKAPKKSKSAGDTPHYPKDGPFEVPEGWVWTTIGEFFNLQAGKFVAADDIHAESPIYPYRCYGGNGIRGYVSTFNRKGDYPIIGRQGALCGNVNYASGEFYATEHAVVVESFGGTDSKWAKYLLEQLNLNQYATATAQPGLSVKTINEVAIPIPPIGEQQRISDAITRCLGIINDIQFSCEELRIRISQTKSHILDLAIHGKLVPQDPNDEPAIELLKRINPDFRPSDNLHYEGELPNGWIMARLGDIVDIVSGTSFQKTDITSSATGIKILRGGNIQNGQIVLCDDDVHISELLLNKHTNVNKGDIVIVASTGSRDLIGKAALSIQDYPRTQIGAFLRIIRPRLMDVSNYLGIIFQSELYKKHIREAAKGTNINNIKSSYITEFVIPIPPLAEQQRIVTTIGNLFTQLDSLADNLS